MILKRKDDTFVIDGPLGPYHVIPSDPLYQETMIAIEGGAEWLSEPEPLSASQEDEARYTADPGSWSTFRCSEIDSALYSKRLTGGFPYEGNIFQADSVAQQNANGFLTAVLAGLPVFPIVWRTKLNTNVEFADAASFSAFATVMLAFVQQQFHETWAAKDALRSAPDYGTASSVYQQYMNPTT